MPLGAGAADVGKTDFGSTSEPDTLMVLSPPVGFALVESVTSATVNDPPGTPDDNAGQVVIPSQKSASGKRATADCERLAENRVPEGPKAAELWIPRFGECLQLERTLNYWIFNGSVRRGSFSRFAFSVINKLISSKCHGRKS